MLLLAMVDTNLIVFYTTCYLHNRQSGN